MSRKLSSILIALLFLVFFLPGKAFATLYINEFSSGGGSDWVEIYNSDSSPVDLSTYRIRDSNATNKIDLSGTISGNGFTTFDWGDNLNSAGGVIKLVLKDDENSKTDEVSYGSSGGVVAPSDSQTAGRSPDGSSNVVLLPVSSKGSSNNSVTPVPAATATPANTPTPTSTPTPTKQPTSTPAKTPTPIPTSSYTTPTKKASTTSEGADSDLMLAADSSNGDLKDVGDSNADKPSVTPETEVLGASTSSSNAPLIFISLGLIFMAVCGILLYFQFGDKIFIWKRKST